MQIHAGLVERTSLQINEWTVCSASECERCDASARFKRHLPAGFSLQSLKTDAIA